MQKHLMNWTARKTKFVVYTLIALYLLLFLPFWQPVLLAFLFASALAPIVNNLRHRLHARRSRIAYLTIGLTITLFIGLVAIIGIQIYSSLFELFQNQDGAAGLNAQLTTVRDRFFQWINSQEYLAAYNIQERLNKSVAGITNSVAAMGLTAGRAFVAAAPEILLSLFVFLTAFGVFLTIQPRIWENMAQALGLGEKGKEHFQRFEKICTLALGSVLLTAFVQSILVVIGASFAGYNAPVMIFAASFILAMIPVIGAGAVPLLLLAVSLIQGESSGAIIMLVTSIIVGVSDNVLRAWLFSRAAKSNPALSIITLLGGIALFGFPGLFLAPVIEQLVMTYAFSSEGEPEPHETASSEEPVNPDRLVEPSGRKFEPA